MPWPGRRFQHLLSVKERHVLEKDESTDPKQDFKRGLVESTIMIGKM